MKLSYEEAVDYIEQIPRFTKKNTPEDTRRFYEYLGRPGEEACIVHVAGTNGKGSVCAYVDSVLRQAGYRTALFTSPHLVDIRERFRLDGEMISRQEFTDTLNECLERCEAFRLTRENKEYHPSYFETLFFIGMLWFAKKGARAIVLETGLGGRLDATNVIARPAVCVITRIGLDHMEYLGDTKEQIAGEKAGIIKKGVPVVFWDSEESVTRVIVEKAREMCAEAIPVSESRVGFEKFKNKTVDFSMRSEYYEYIRVCLHTAAAYQRENAALAVRALEVLARREPDVSAGEAESARRGDVCAQAVCSGEAESARGGDGRAQAVHSGETESARSKDVCAQAAHSDKTAPCRRIVLSREQIETGFALAKWEGRMDEVMPGIILDGAHNEDGIRAFLESVREDGCRGKRALLFSVVSDKRAAQMAEQILESGLFADIAVAGLMSSRSLSSGQLNSLWKGKAAVYETPEEALRALKERRGAEDLIYAAGSLYLVGQLLESLQKS